MSNEHASKAPHNTGIFATPLRAFPHTNGSGAPSHGHRGRSFPRASRLALTALAGILLAALAFGAGTASAALQYPFLGQLTGISSSTGVAVDDQSAQTLVAGFQNGNLVAVFDSEGAQAAEWRGSNTPAGSFGNDFLAVAADNATGRVYVADRQHDVVDVFDSAGSYVCQITGAGSATTSSSECDSGDPGAPGGRFGFIEAMTVDQATGDVYVADQGREVVDVFDAAGKYVSQLTGASTPATKFSSVTGLAVDDQTEDVLVADSGAHVIYVFNATSGAYVTSWSGSAATNPPGAPAGSFGTGRIHVDANDGTGDVYVTDPAHAVVDQLEGSGDYVGQIAGVPGGASLLEPSAVGVDQASGNVYVGDSGKGLVDIFAGTQVVVPDVTTGSTSPVAATTATPSGTVNPDSIQLTDCRFEYGTTTSYGQSAACVPAAGSIPPDANNHTISAAINGLQPDTTYHYRLVAGNANGANYGADQTFTTTGPVIDNATSTATNLTATAVDLIAQIDPVGEDTTYHFEYGTADCSSHPCASVPVPDADIGSGSTDVAVTQHITGLAANTEYYWRVVATNTVNGGIVTSPEHTFIYDTTGQGLPDNRAYEQVTSPQKNGALVENSLGALPIDVAADGSRIVYVVNQCFGGAGSCSVRNISLNNPFLATRTASGWVSTAMEPSSSLAGGSPGIFSADAGTALYSIPTPPAGEDDLYARRPEGSFQDIGPATSPARGPLGRDGVFPIGVAATVDLSHVVWADGRGAWPFDASLGEGDSEPLEYSGSGNSQPAMVAVSGPGPGATDQISPGCGSAFGSSPKSEPGEMSADGRTVFFLAKSGLCNAGLGGPPADEVGARIDGTLADAHTVILSQHSPADCHAASGCASSPPANAEFWGASSDGSKAFFTSSQQLTDSATQVSENLYLYDFDNPSGQELLDVSAGDTSGAGPGVQGVVGFSSDGSHVYFIANGVLAAGASPGDCEVPNNKSTGSCNLYVYERDATYPGGHTAFIATLSGIDAVKLAVDTYNWPYANVTPDGRYLVFASDRALTSAGANANGAMQVFRYDAQTGQLIRLSVGNRGFDDNGNAGIGEAKIVPAVDGVLRAGPARLDPTMSYDGSRVFFQSPIGLTPHALDDVQTGIIEGEIDYAENVYEWEQAGVGSCPAGQSAGCVYLISDGRDTSAGTSFCSGAAVGQGAVCLLGADTTGQNVFFTTADQLVPSDTDSGLDIYDARVCEPEHGDPCITAASTPPPCLGEQCHGTPPAIPGAPNTPTSTFDGAGNVVPAGNVGPVPVRPGSKGTVATRTVKLAKALRACHRARARKQRAECERQARKAYGSKVRAKKTSRRAGR